MKIRYSSLAIGFGLFLLHYEWGLTTAIAVGMLMLGYDLNKIENIREYVINEKRR